MTELSVPERSRDVAFTDQDFETIAGLAKAECGLHLEPAKKPLVYSRLIRRLRARGLMSFAAYCDLLSDHREEAERGEMMAALTTNVTQFFRERHHFDQLAREVLPPLVRRAREGGRVRLWSAACSSGQEPYSIAATVAELCPEAGRLDIRMLATDIDPNVLSVALAGHYPREEAESLGPAQQARLFEKGNTDFPVRRQLRDLVAFRRLNLMGDWPMAGRFDVIFCRNVAIYFDKPTQERLWSRLAAQMAFGGVLFIGHSERITGPATTLLENAGTTSYRLRGGTSPGHGARTWD